MAKSDHGRLTLRAIEIFVAVVEEGSLATGARRLGASPSSVSQQISNLEAALGARLIDRSARPFALTPAGFVFQRRALAILDEAARAQSELAELELTGLPQLRLAVIEDFDADVTPALASALADALPGCNIIAHVGPSHLNLSALEARSEDIVVAAEMETPHDWIEQHPLLRDPYVLVISKGLLDQTDNPVARLMAAPMVRYASSQLMGQQIETHLRRLRLAPDRRYEFDSNHSIMATVAEARGWAVTTPLGFMRAHRFHESLELRPLPFQKFSRVVSLYARRGVMGALPTRTAELMRSLLKQHCISEGVAHAPWLSGSFRVLGEEAPAGTSLRLVGTP
ncbi:MAG: LysR family transcriptional regulator [Pseudomonadota bacterium]